MGFFFTRFTLYSSTTPILAGKDQDVSCHFFLLQLILNINLISQLTFYICIYREAEAAFSSNNITAARGIVAKLKYYNNIYEKVKEFETQHGIVY